jgi:hypothetical protein
MSEQVLTFNDAQLSFVIKRFFELGVAVDSYEGLKLKGAIEAGIQNAKFELGTDGRAKVTANGISVEVDLPQKDKELFEQMALGIEADQMAETLSERYFGFGISCQRRALGRGLLCKGTVSKGVVKGSISGAINIDRVIDKVFLESNSMLGNAGRALSKETMNKRERDAGL